MTQKGEKRVFPASVHLSNQRHLESKLGHSLISFGHSVPINLFQGNKTERPRKVKKRAFLVSVHLSKASGVKLGHSLISFGHSAPTYARIYENRVKDCTKIACWDIHMNIYVKPKYRLKMTFLFTSQFNKQLFLPVQDPCELMSIV